MTSQPRTPEPFTAPERAILDALRINRDEGGEGLHAWEIHEISGLVYVESFNTKAKAQGYVIGVTNDGLYNLGHHEPSEQTGAPAKAPFPPADVGSDVPVCSEGEQLSMRLDVPSVYRDAAWIFAPEMVKAIQASKKTQTRRSELIIMIKESLG